MHGIESIVVEMISEEVSCELPVGEFGVRQHRRANRCADEFLQENLVSDADIVGYLPPHRTH